MPVLDDEESRPVDVETDWAGVNRRGFMALLAGGAGGAALVGATAAAAWPRPRELSQGPGATTEAPSDPDPHAGHGAGPAASGGSATPSADEMDALHAEGVEQFLANRTSPITSGRGATDLEWEMVDGVRVFELTCSNIEWEVLPGQFEAAYAFNGIVPGPTLRVVEGQPVRILVHNQLDESTAVHWHGQRIVNAMDGMPYLTQPPIRPGETFVYEFVPGPFGSHMYHSHHNAAEQVLKGMLGALIVEPADPADEPTYDQDHLYILNDVLGGFTINGKGFPATDAYTAKLGERVRFRFMNEGLMVHPIHLHGLTMEIFARDGYPLPQPFRCDTITVAPGERWDAIVVADNPGAWAFHCHVLTHAESSHGMFGMVTVMFVEED